MTPRATTSFDGFMASTTLLVRDDQGQLAFERLRQLHVGYCLQHNIDPDRLDLDHPYFEENECGLAGGRTTMVTGLRERVCPSMTRVYKSSSTWIHRNRNWILEYVVSPSNGYVLSRAVHPCGSCIVFSDKHLVVSSHKVNHEFERDTVRYSRLSNGSFVLVSEDKCLFGYVNGDVRGFVDGCLRLSDIRASGSLYMFTGPRGLERTSSIIDKRGVTTFFDGPRGCERVIKRIYPDGREYRYLGPRDMEAVVYCERDGGNTKQWFVGQAGNEHIICEQTPEGRKDLEGPRGQERIVRIHRDTGVAFLTGPKMSERITHIDQHDPECRHYYEGPGKQERRVKTVWPDGRIDHWSGARCEERIIHSEESMDVRALRADEMASQLLREEAEERSQKQSSGSSRAARRSRRRKASKRITALDQDETSAPTADAAPSPPPVQTAMERIDRDVPSSPFDVLNECVVCMDAPRTHLVAPCGHKCLCEACANGLMDCPICRNPALCIVRVFE